MMETLRKQLEEARLAVAKAEQNAEEAKRREAEERKAKEDAEKAKEDAEKAKEDAEKDFAPVAFPVALARIYSIKDCSSTATKPHVHDYGISPSTTIFKDFGNGQNLLARAGRLRAPARLALQHGDAGRSALHAERCLSRDLCW